MIGKALLGVAAAVGVARMLAPEETAKAGRKVATAAKSAVATVREPRRKAAKAKRGGKTAGKMGGKSSAARSAKAATAKPARKKTKVKPATRRKAPAKRAARKG